MLKYPSVKSTKGEGTRVLIGGNKSVKDWFERRLNKSSIIHDYLHRNYTLAWKDCFCVALSEELPLIQIIRYLDLIIKWGGILVIAGHFLFSIVMHIPFLMLLLFYGSYTKKGFITFWEMLPLFKGVGWAVALFTIALELFNMALVGLASMYLLDVFNSKLPWEDCSFKEATTKCYSLESINSSYTEICSFENGTKNPENLVHLAAYEYLLKNKLQAPDEYSSLKEGIGALRTTWIEHVAAAWFVVFVAASLGLKYCRPIMTTIARIFVVVSSLEFITMFLISLQFPKPSLIASRFGSFFRVEFWVDMLVHSFARELPGNWIFFGSIAPINMVPHVHVYNIYGWKHFSHIFLIIWFSISIQIVQIIYRITDITCIPTSGIIHIFALAPELLTRTHAKHALCFVYFCGLWFLGISSTINSVISCLDSATEQIRKIGRYRIFFTAMLCFTCFVFNIILLTSYFFTNLEIWTKIGYTVGTLMLMFLFVTALFIYSSKATIDDFQFVYGKRLSDYWSQSWKLTSTVVFMLFPIVIFCNLGTENNYGKTKTIMSINFVFLVIILIPVFINAIWKYLEFKNMGQSVLVVTPTRLWGSPDVSRREERKKFHPHKVVRFRIKDLKSKHNCLLKSDKLQHEIERLRKNQNRLMDAIRINDH